MSNATWTALVYAALVAGCASAGSPSQPPDADGVTPHHDDAANVAPDAGVKMDAPMVVPDAFVPQDAAAPVDSALFCSDNSQCTNAGECCIILGSPPGICGTGVIVAGVCIPQ
jgi:hypothetical protein